MIRDEDVGSNPILAFFIQQVSTGIETVFGRMQSRCIGRVVPLQIAVSIIGQRCALDRRYWSNTGSTFTNDAERVGVYRQYVTGGLIRDWLD